MKLSEVLPREHGAWAMWIVPILTAIMVAGFQPVVLLFAVSFALLYMIHHPVVRVIKTRRFGDWRENRILFWIAAPAVAIGAVLVFGFRYYLLVPFAVVEIALFWLSVNAFVEREQRSVPNEFVAAAALTLAGPIAYYVLTRRVDVNALQIYALNLLFFGSSIFYVRSRIERLKSKGEKTAGLVQSSAITLTYHVVLVIVVVLLSVYGSINALMILAFVPMIVQVYLGMVWSSPRISFKRLGVVLVVQSLVFLVGVRVFWK